METYLLGSAIAFGLAIIVILIQQALLLPMSPIERMQYEHSGGRLGGSVTLKDALANAVLSWIGVVLLSFVLIMVTVSLFSRKK